MAMPLAVTHSSLAPALLLAWDAAGMAGSLSSVLFTLPCSFLLLSSYSFIIIFLLLFAVLLFIYLFHCFLLHSCLPLRNAPTLLQLFWGVEGEWGSSPGIGWCQNPPFSSKASYSKWADLGCPSLKKHTCSPGETFGA